MDKILGIESDAHSGKIERNESVDMLLPAWCIVLAWSLGILLLQYLQRTAYVVGHLISPACSKYYMLAFRASAVVFLLTVLLVIVWKNHRLIGKGLSAPLILFGILFFIRLLHESYYHLLPNGTGGITDLLLSIERIFVTILVVTLMSCGIPPLSSTKIRTFILLALAAIVLLIYLTWGKYMIQGYTLRDNYVYMAEKFIESRGTLGLIVLFVPMIGGISAALSLWAWGESLMKTRYFVPFCLAGTALVYFSGTRTFLMATFVTLAAVVFLSNCHKKRGFTLVLILLIVANLASLFYVGHNGKRSLLKRFSEVRSEYRHGKERLDELVRTQTLAVSEPPPPAPVSEPKPTLVSESNPAPLSEPKPAPPGPKTTDTESDESIKVNARDVETNIETLVSDTKSHDGVLSSGKEDGDIDANIISMPARFSGRMGIYFDSLMRVAENPLFGYGLSPYKYEGPKRAMVHNIYLEAFLATGVFGGLLFLATVLRSLVDSLYCFKDSPKTGWLAVIFIYTAIQSFFQDNLASSLVLFGTMVSLRANTKQILGDIRKNTSISKECEAG